MVKMIKARARKIGKLRCVISLILFVSVIATLIFVFSNSAKTKAVSNEQSSSFKVVLEKFVSHDTKVGSFLLNNIRKVAHFTEYGLLGIETATLVFLLTEGRKRRYLCAPKLLLFALLTAFVDETIQIFSKRGPSISDMWIDVGGFFTYSLFAYACIEVLLLIRLIVLKIKRSRNAKKTD